MKAVLRVWNVRHLKVVLVGSGRFSLWQGLVSKGPVQGRAYRTEGDWFAVYSKEGSLHFRKNREEFSISSDLQCAYERSSDGTRCLILKIQGLEVLRHRYRTDMDVAREESEDFFLWIARLLNDKARQAKMLMVWSDAGLRGKQESSDDVPKRGP